MKDISLFFESVNEEFSNSGSMLKEVKIHTSNDFPELDQKGLAFIYVPEYRNSPQADLQKELKANNFRKAFYSLEIGFNWNFVLYDLGTIIPGETVEDTYTALRSACAELIKKDIVPIVIGGTQDLVFPIFQSYESLEQMVNILSVDARLDLGAPEEAVNSNGYVSQLLMHRPNYLFNYSVIGLQAPYIKKEELDLFGKLYFDNVRLGEFNNDFKIAEPHIRYADFMHIDLTSVRSSDIRGEMYNEPNGFFNHQLCQIARYAGISDKLTSFAILNYFPSEVISNDALLAQVIWYFLDGYAQRFGDFPIGTKKNYIKFTVVLEEIKHELCFYKSERSQRWWLEVPYPAVEGVVYERQHMVPCDKQDYDAAKKGVIPSLWWRTLQKLS